MMFQLQRVLVLALTHAVLRIQRWWRTLSDGLHVQVDMLALYWDKVDHIARAGDGSRAAEEGRDGPVGRSQVPYSTIYRGARFTEIAKKSCASRLLLFVAQCTGARLGRHCSPKQSECLSAYQRAVPVDETHL